MAHEEDNIDTSMVAIVGVISAGISFALIFLLMVLYHSFNNAQEAVEMVKPHEVAERLLSEQRAILNEAAWVNQETGQVRIPVSTAMGLVVQQLQETPEDAGVNPPEFAEADATISDPSKVLGSSEKNDDGSGDEPVEGSSADEKPADESAPKTESTESSKDEPSEDESSAKTE